VGGGLKARDPDYGSGRFPDAKKEKMMRTGETTENQAAQRRRYYHPIQKDYATFLQTSEETGGEYSLIEVEVAPGGGNEPHYHKTYDEHFEVLEGALEVLVGEETKTLRPSQKAVAQKNVLHRFRNTTEERTRFLVELRPGHAGFEKAVKVAYGLASDGRTLSDGTPKNPYHLAVLLEWSDIRLPGVFTLAEPLLRLLARRARRKGIDKDLEARYCE
jgi:mannose-6-phosphate isomerase-like protein (cupin superfamily)